jgi:hypothetical protein
MDYKHQINVCGNIHASDHGDRGSYDNGVADSGVDCRGDCIYQDNLDKGTMRIEQGILIKIEKPRQATKDILLFSSNPPSY